MPTYSEPKSYNDNDILTEAMLDEGRDYRTTFLNTTKLDEDNLQDGAVTAAKLASNAVTTAKITDSNVTTAKLADNAVTNLKIDDSASGPAALLNCDVTPSVAASALTIALKTLAGTDATASDPITIAFRSSTLTSGTYVTRTVTGALSVVVSSGSTLGHTSATEWPIYVYAIDNAGTVELAVSTSPVDERYRQSTTAEGGAGAADAVTGLYSTTARTNVGVRLIAVLKSTQATAGTWATAPSAVSQPTAPHPLAVAIARPASATAGVGGVAISASCGAFSTTSATLTDVTSLSVTLTTSGRPVRLMLVGASTSTAKGRIGLNHDVGTTGGGVDVAFDRGGATLVSLEARLSQASTDSGGGMFVPCSAINHLDTDAAAGTYTYKVQMRKGSGTTGTVYMDEVKLVAYEI